jgi:putative membrane protein insertion efficiency factor
LTLGQRAALFVLRGYKLMLSPLFAGSCRFLPSCSDYAREAIVEHGLTKGTWLAARRLGRCHPFGSSGYDPVPSADAKAPADRPAFAKTAAGNGEAPRG